MSENKDAVKVVKRNAEGNLTVVGTMTERQSKAFFSVPKKDREVTDYRGKGTKHISQCSLINTLLEEGMTVLQIVDKVISLGAFPANPSKYDYDNLKIRKACKARVVIQLKSLIGKHKSGSKDQTTADPFLFLKAQEALRKSGV